MTRKLKPLSDAGDNPDQVLTGRHRNPANFIDGTRHLVDAAPELLSSLRRLLACPDLNLDELEPETIDALEQAQKAIGKAEGR